MTKRNYPAFVKREPSPGDPSIYAKIRADIISGKIRPNSRLIEAELADFYDVSRTPVREALQRLYENKLINRIKSGWVVREYSLDEIKEIYEVNMGANKWRIVTNNIIDLVILEMGLKETAVVLQGTAVRVTTFCRD